MASKKDLTEAQSFSRRRLLTAFTSGAVGTTELEPARPMRAVVAGLALTALVVVGGVFYGLISPGLPEGWQNNRLVLEQDTGARYVSADGTLYPVVNAASARLLIPSTEFAVVTTSSRRLTSVPVGEPVGILGAPDQLPSRDALLGTAWTACLTPSGTPQVTVSAAAVATPTTQAALVSTSAGQFVVAGTTRYPVDPEQSAAVLRAVGLGGAVARPVDDRWLNLFLPGSALEPLVVDGAGEPVAGTDLVAGQAVHVAGSAADDRYLVEADGSLATLEPLAYQLYLLGTGATQGAAKDLAAAQTAALPNSPAPAGAADWPASPLAPAATDARLCALAGGDATGPTATFALGAPGATSDATATLVDTGSGALVRATGRGAKTVGTVYLVDATGTAFPVEDDAETLARLGYAPEDVVTIGDGWVDLLLIGPRLSSAAAGSSPLATTAGTADAP